MSESQIYLVRSPTSVRQLMERLGGVERLDGDPDRLVKSVAALGAGDRHTLSFCRFEGEEGRARVSAVMAGVVICGLADLERRDGRVVVVVADPRGWFIDALAILDASGPKDDWRPGAAVHPDAQIGENVEIGPQAVIEAGAIIGDRCRIGAFAFVSSAATLEADVMVQPHAVIGTPGLSFHHRPDGTHAFFPHKGRAVIGRGATIGVHSTVVRGILMNTTIGPGCEIGNYVNVGHNCVVGAGSFVSSGVVLAGGAQLGPGARLAAGVTVTAHCRIGAEARVGLGSVVVKDIPAEQRYFGNPARPLPTMRDF